MSETHNYREFLDGEATHYTPVEDEPLDDLFTVIGMVDMDGYCASDYWRWEDRVARPALEALGYTQVCFSMGECDSFGPLSRIVTATKDGVVRRMVYA